MAEPASQTDSEYDEIMAAAERDASGGNYKDAYNTLARALSIGGPADQECRYRRGLYAYEVAHSRLNGIRASPIPNQTLIKAGCWLARSEAYLSSATEEVPDDRRHAIERDLARTKREQDRFRRLSTELEVDLFVSQSELMNGD